MSHDDRDLERIFERVRDPAPSGLEERLLAGLADPHVAERFRAEDRADVLARAVRLSLFGFAVAVVVLAFVLLAASERSPWERPTFTPAPSVSPAPRASPATPVDEALLAFAGKVDHDERTSYWLSEAK